MSDNRTNILNEVAFQTDSLTSVLREQNKAIDRIANEIDTASNSDKLFDLFSYDTVFTVFITLAIFLLGVIVDRIIKLYDTYKSKKDLRIYFHTYLERITNSTCVKLSEFYKKIYQEIDIDEGIPTTAPKILTGDFERLKDIDGNLIFHAIKEKQNLSKIHSYLDFVEKLIPEIDRFHSHCRIESDKLLKPFQEKLNNYFDLLAEFVEFARINQSNYENYEDFIQLVNNSISIYHQEYSQSRKIRKLYREIIRPIQEMAIDSNLFRQDQRCFGIVVLGKELSYQYNYLKRLTIDFKIGYRRFHNDIRDYKTKLELETKKINWR